MEIPWSRARKRAARLAVKRSAAPADSDPSVAIRIVEIIAVRSRLPPSGRGYGIPAGKVNRLRSPASWPNQGGVKAPSDPALLRAYPGLRAGLRRHPALAGATPVEPLRLPGL